MFARTAYFLVLVAAASIRPPAQPVVQGVPPDFFWRNDYPPVAVRNHWHGTVVVHVTLGRGGHVRTCRVVQSSGHKLLDDLTCNSLVRRASFRLEDLKGIPTDGVYELPPIVWSF